MSGCNYRVSGTLAPAAPLSSPTLFRGDIKESFRKLHELGFNGVELQFPLPLEKELLSQVKLLSEEFQMPVCAFATGSLYTKKGISLISQDPDQVFAGISGLQSYVDAAQALGAKVIVGCVRGNITESERQEDCEERLAKALSKVLNYAADRNVHITLEAINRYENNYLNTAAQCVAFIEKYELLDLGILLDTFHMNIEERSMEKAIYKAAPYLSHVHLADRTRLVPGTAGMDFKAVMGALEEISYRHWVSIEAMVERAQEKEAEEGFKHLMAL